MNVRTLLLTTALSLSVVAYAPPAHAVAGCSPSGVTQINNHTTSRTDMIIQAIVTMQNEIVKTLNALSAVETEQNNIQNQQENAQRVMDDAKVRADEYNKDEHQKIREQQRVALDTAEQVKRTVTECAGVTSMMVASYFEGQYREEITARTTEDATRQITGIPGGVTQANAKLMKKMQDNLKKGGKYAASYSPSVVATEHCDSPECFNESLKNNLEATLLASSSNKPPLSASLNPIMEKYLADWAEWSAKRNDALRVVNDFLPKKMTSKANYDQALKFYAEAFGDVVGRTKLLQEYQRADIIGISARDLVKIEFTALLKGVGVRGGALNEHQQRRNQDRLRALVEENKLLNDEEAKYDAAMAQLRVKAPAIPTAGTAVGNTQ